MARTVAALVYYWVMRPRAWAAFAAVSVIWGVPYFFIKIAVAEVSPLFLAWVRVAIGAAILLPLAWRAGALRGLAGRWRAVIAFALVEITGPFVLIPLGERWVSSSLAAILIAAVPLTVALLAIRFAPSERPGGTRLVGLLIGLAGVVALLGIDVAGRPLELLGAACILGATLGYAGGPIIVKARLADLHPLGPVSVGLVASSVVLLPAALLGAPARVPSGAAVLALLALGVVCTAAGLALFFYLVAEAGPSKATVITYVNPAVAVALGVAVLGERIGAVAVAGLLLILAGSWLSTGGRVPPGFAAGLTWPLRRAPRARGRGWSRQPPPAMAARRRLRRAATTRTTTSTTATTSRTSPPIVSSGSRATKVNSPLVAALSSLAMVAASICSMPAGRGP